MTHIIAVLALILMLGAAACTTETTDTPSDFTADTAEISAADVVDFMSADAVDTFCTAYYQLGDYELAFDQFAQGYGASQDPSAEEVFDELLARC